MEYTMSLVGHDIDIVLDTVNQGIDTYLQAITQSEFQFYQDFGTKLRCVLRGKDVGVFIRRLLESSDEDAFDLAQVMVEVMGYDDIMLTFDDRFIFSGTDPKTGEDFDEIVSVFDENFWEDFEFPEEE